MTDKVITPELEQFVLKNVRLTGVSLGAGAYGSVEEVEIPGATVAAKKLHPQLIKLDVPHQGASKWITDFVKECKLMSQLRHPHIVQFMGICYLPGSSLPVLLMEKLLTSLHDLLEVTPDIPLEVKVHFLIGTARGVVYLHSHTPPIAHRDLTARNILVDSGLTAKVTDLGVARMVSIQPDRLAATMTNVPGNSLYMPPEAIQDETTRYNIAIDIFSFGVVSLFVVTQIFPKNLKPPTYRNSITHQILARSEIERREHYIESMQAHLGETHSLVKLTLDCLKYDPEGRPSATELLRQLEEVERELPQNCTETKLELIQQISKNKMDRKLSSSKGTQAEIAKLQSTVHRLEVANDQKQAQIDRLEADKKDLAQRVDELSKLVQLQVRLNDQALWESQSSEEQRSRKEDSPASPLKEDGWTMVRAKITFDWSRCKDRPDTMELYGQPVVHNGKLYFSGFTQGHASVLEYTPDSDLWSELPQPSVRQFTIATLKGQLLVVGGEDEQYTATNTILTFDEPSQTWIHSYPRLPSALTNPAVIGYQNDLIVAGGHSSSGNKVVDVNILSVTKKMWPWVRACSLPNTDDYCTVLIEDTVFLVGQSTRSVQMLEAQTPGFISGVVATFISSSKWVSLPNTVDFQASPIAISNTLFTVGGSGDTYGGDPTTGIQRYDSTESQWTRVGDLPEAIRSCRCTVLSGKLFVFGGNGSKCVYVATVYH